MALLGRYHSHTRTESPLKRLSFSAGAERRAGVVNLCIKKGMIMTYNRSEGPSAQFGWDVGQMWSNRGTLGKGVRRRIMTALRMSSSCVMFGRQRHIGALFGVGHLLMGHTVEAAVSAVALIASGWVVIRAMVRVWR